MAGSAPWLKMRLMFRASMHGTCTGAPARRPHPSVRLPRAIASLRDAGSVSSTSLPAGGRTVEGVGDLVGAHVELGRAVAEVGADEVLRRRGKTTSIHDCLIRFNRINNFIGDLCGFFCLKLRQMLFEMSRRNPCDRVPSRETRGLAFLMSGGKSPSEDKNTPGSDPDMSRYLLFALAYHMPRISCLSRHRCLVCCSRRCHSVSVLHAQ